MPRLIPQIVSWLSLIYVVIPPMLFWLGKVDEKALKVHMLIATMLWFIATPLWMGREVKAEKAP